MTVSAGDSADRVSAVQAQLAGQGWRLAVDEAFGPQTNGTVDPRLPDRQTAHHHLVADAVVGPQTWNVLVAGFDHHASPELASAHLNDAWGADDRVTALRNATQAAVDLLLRGQRGTLTSVGCSADEMLGPGHATCSYTYEGGAVSLHAVGNSIDGYYVESASFIAD